MANDNMNAESSASQAKRILEYLKAGGRLTPMDALAKFHTMRLGARIKDVEEMLGFPPSRQRVKKTNAEGKEVWVMEYYLEKAKL